MAALARLFKTQFPFLLRRSLSTTTTTTATVSEIQPQRQRPNSSILFPLTDDPKGCRNFQWVFLGCPGVGKGTYAGRLSSLLGVPHIATGDLVREELSSSGPLSHQVSFSIFIHDNRYNLSLGSYQVIHNYKLGSYINPLQIMEFVDFGTKTFSIYFSSRR